jgi:hypothetical protein
MTRKNRELTKKILRHSTDGVNPDLDAMLSATPSLLRQARRARATAEANDSIWDQLTPMLARSLPALAIVAVLLVVFVGWDMQNVSSGPQQEPSQSTHMESLLLTGEVANDAVADDPLLGVLLIAEENDV